MRYLIKKMGRDLKKNWSQFASVFLMSMLSVLIFSGMASVWTGMNQVTDSYSRDASLAQTWIYAAGISQDQKEELLKLEGVEHVTRSASQSFSLNGENGELEITAPENLDVFHPVRIEGDSIDLEQEGIWIDRDFARAHDLKTGDTVALNTSAGVQELEIRGIIMDPEYIYYTGSTTETVPDYGEYGYGVVNTGTMEKLAGGMQYTEARLDQEITQQQAEDILGNTYMGIDDRDSYTAYSRVEKESSQMQKMAMLFSAVFILLALLTMYTSMVRLVNNQMIQIGTMKAMGIRGSAIRLHYALYGLCVPILGGVAGLILGRFTVSRVVMGVKMTTLALPEWKLVHSPLSFGLLLLIALICMFAAMWAAGRGLRGLPAQTMRGTASEKAMKTEKNNEKKWARIPYFWRWVLRDIGRNKARFCMGVIGVAGGLLLLIAGLGIRNSIQYSNDFVFDQQYRYEAKGVLETAGRKPQLDGEHQWLEESSIDLEAEEGEDRLTLTVCDEGGLIRFFDREDREIQLPDEGALVSAKTAENLNISAGDTVRMRIAGSTEWIEVKIAGVSKTLSPQGLFFSKTAFESLGQTFVETSVVTKSISEEELKQTEGIKSAISKERQYENTNTVAESVMTIVKLLIIASVLLSVVILYNLGILSFVERTREYATMKVLGFFQSEIRSIALRECVLSTVIGWLIGIPAGIKFLELYIRIVSFDNFEWVSEISPVTILIASVVIVGTSFAVNLLISHKVRKINMVEALKSLE